MKPSRLTLIFTAELTWLIAIGLLSEFCTYFDKTQWCLIAIMCWLINISADIRKDYKDD